MDYKKNTKYLESSQESHISVSLDSHRWLKGLWSLHLGSTSAWKWHSKKSLLISGHTNCSDSQGKKNVKVNWGSDGGEGELYMHNYFGEKSVF